MDGFKIPSFTLTQDDSQVFLSVHCASEPAIAVEGTIFGLHADDVYLPLVFPDRVTKGSVEYAQEKADIILIKAEGGHWDDLEQLIPQLMPSDQMAAAQADAELGKGLFSQNDETSMAAREMLRRGLQKENLVEEGKPMEGVKMAPSSDQPIGYGYGLYANFHGPIIPAGSSDLRSMLQVSDPLSLPLSQRSQIAEDYENQKWDEGIYMENHLDPDGELAFILRFTPEPLSASLASSSQGVLPTESSCTLVELLYGFAYDSRTNMGQVTVESGWTISQLSRSLSASAVPPTLAHTVRALLRRTLSLALWRNWKLAQQCLNDVQHILRSGQAQVIAALQEVEIRLEATENGGIETRLIEVWLSPLLQEVSSASDDFFQTLGSNLQVTAQQITKDDVGGEAWGDLDILEKAAEQAYADGEGGFI